MLPETGTSGLLPVPVILAGGQGTRLWPLSRPVQPKPFLRLCSSRSMLQETALRVQVFGDPVFVCGMAHTALLDANMVAIGLTPACVIAEPVGRNTGPAIAAAAALYERADPVLLFLPSDHMIRDARAFQDSIRAGLAAAEAGRIVTFGVCPTGPETRFGYLRYDKDGVAMDGFALLNFVEKPDRATARQWIGQGDYLWNSGIFMARARVLIEVLRRLCPAVMDVVERAMETGILCRGALQPAAHLWSSLPGAPFDRMVMEHIDPAQATVFPAAGWGWDDLGTWSGLMRAQLARFNPGRRSIRS